MYRTTGNFDKFDESELKFNQSIYPNKCLYNVKQGSDVKHFIKVYFVKPVEVRICQSFPSPKFPVVW